MPQNVVITPKLVDADGVVTALRVGDQIAWVPDSYSIVVLRGHEQLCRQFSNDHKIFSPQIRTEIDFLFFVSTIFELSGFNFVPYRWGSEGQYPGVTVAS